MAADDMGVRLRVRTASDAPGLPCGCRAGMLVRVSHPDPRGAPDRAPIQTGEVSGEPRHRWSARLFLELPWQNPEGRAVAELVALVGARVAGEHRHPAITERFTVLEGELTVKRDGQTSILREGRPRRDPARHMARLVERRGPRRPGSRGDHAGERLVQMIDDRVRARAARSRERQGHVFGSSPAGLRVRARVQRRDRVPHTAAGDAAHRVRRAGADRPAARLWRDVPADLPHGAGAPRGGSGRRLTAYPRSPGPGCQDMAACALATPAPSPRDSSPARA